MRMTILPYHRFGRRTFMGGGLAWALSAVSAAATAEPGTLDADKLEDLVRLALAEDDETPLSRPAILGLGPDKLTTKSIEREEPGERYGFMVIIPRREDGLIFFRGADNPLFFAIHRTGSRLKRIASAINRDGDQEEWSGRGAEADFARQLASWAK
jgi:hypothetical protein